MDITVTFSTFVEWVKQLWNKIDIKSWADSMGGSSSDAVQAAIYFGGGFAVGFLFKKYFKFLFSCALLTVIVILFLQHNKVLDIDWEACKVLLGFDPTADMGTLLDSLFDWIKNNLMVVISSSIGFLIGCRLG